MKFPTAPIPRPPSKKDKGRASLRVVVGLALVGLTLLLTNVFSAPPAWWTTQGVLDATQDQDNYSGVTVGQLKNMAVKAMNEMDARFPGGAGAPIHAMVQDWRDHKTEENQFAAATVGQVKVVSKLFYDRLIAVGARPASPAYPWPSDTPIAENYAAANVGQVKNIFVFAIPDLSDPDTDGDGIPDSWELAHGLNPNDPSDGLSDADADGYTALQEYQRSLLGQTSGINPNVWDLVSSEDLDGDGVPNYMDADPHNPNVGVMNVLIATPVNGQTL